MTWNTRKQIIICTYHLWHKGGYIMLYYRGTSQNNPMSNWGHAMFTKDLEAAYFDDNHGYGWTFDGNLATPITDDRAGTLRAKNWAALLEYLLKQ